MKKVLFLIQGELLPSSRVRVMNLLPELQKEGIRYDVIKYPKRLSEKIGLIRLSRKYDVVYLQKKLLSPLDILALRKYSKKIIFDFDDAIYYRHDKNESLYSRTRFLKFKYIVRNSDLIVAGNRVLSDYVSKFNKNVIIIPSAVETRNIPLREHHNNGKRIVIGWIGGDVNLIHLRQLSPVFQRLAKEYDIQLRIISNWSIEVPSVEVVHIQWSLETQEKEVALLDIGVMPLPNNKHTEGKCGYKALQYMAASVPPVCSDVGGNRDIVEHGKEGFVLPSFDMFYDSIKSLIESGSLRKDMGANARQKAETHFSVSVIGRRLAEVLLTV
ncbi:MAG: glycosyltransferase family 4 protein [Nitrospira sp.]|nr:glycosyltransferase family 4 protein [Nitrospira sp.]